MHHDDSFQHGFNTTNELIPTCNVVFLCVLWSFKKEYQRNSWMRFTFCIRPTDAMLVRLVETQRHEVQISCVGPHGLCWTFRERPQRRNALPKLDVPFGSQRKNEDMRSVRVAVPIDLVVRILKSVAEHVNDVAVKFLFDSAAQGIQKVEPCHLFWIPLALEVIRVLRQFFPEQHWIVIPRELGIVVEDSEGIVGLVLVEKAAVKEDPGHLLRLVKRIQEWR
mmetsp:Transcript_18718/g.53365  ORF Transcript_18718/g.53365 Transcript_18718/m.53365 type:complete len:222 (+) Transcript_18718:41-706(+)